MANAIRVCHTWICCPAMGLGDINIAAIALSVLPVSPHATHSPSSAEQDIADHESLASIAAFALCNVAKFNSKSYSGWIKSLGSDLKLSGTWPWMMSSNAFNAFVHSVGLTWRASAINSYRPLRPAPTICGTWITTPRSVTSPTKLSPSVSFSCDFDRLWPVRRTLSWIFW